MKFSEKIKHILEVKGMNNRDLSNKINVQESLVSRWSRSEKVSMTFINHLVQVFPDIDLNYLLKDEKCNKVYEPLLDNNLIEDETEIYKKSKNPKEIIEEIEARLSILKQKLAQDCHEKN